MVLGGVDGSTFGCFICSLIAEYPEILEPSAKMCFVLDNCTIHHARILKNLRSFLKIFFLPPYSPFLTPIEEFFGLVKHYYRRNICENDKELSWNIL